MDSCTASLFPLSERNAKYHKEFTAVAVRHEPCKFLDAKKVPDELRGVGPVDLWSPHQEMDLESLIEFPSVATQIPPSLNSHQKESLSQFILKIDNTFRVGVRVLKEIVVRVKCLASQPTLSRKIKGWVKHQFWQFAFLADAGKNLVGRAGQSMNRHGIVVFEPQIESCIELPAGNIKFTQSEAAFRFVHTR